MPRKKQCKQRLKEMNVKRWKSESLHFQEPGTSSVSDNTEKCAKQSIRLQNLVSEAKIMNEEAQNNLPCNDIPRYMIVDIGMISELFKFTACPDCYSRHMKIVMKNKNGFSQKLEVFCEQCNETKCSKYTSGPASDGKGYDVNYKITKAFIEIGRGHSAVDQFGAVMNMSVMSDKTFDMYLRKLYKNRSDSTNKMFDVVHSKVRKAYGDILTTVRPIINIAVSFDGTWHTRGHNSNYAVGCVIDVLTGYVIDFEVMSKFCYACDNAKRDLGETSPEFNIFLESHKSECFINHTGSSNSMEMQAALKLWQRSEEKRFRYTTILSDGDSKTYTYLSDKNVYGSKVTIEKEECVNHVSKRLGTALRNVVKTYKARGITLGGRSHGSVKESTIQKLTNYYQKAILSNKGDISSMKTAIYATLYHSISTDDNPKHFKCPDGKNSWCFYNAAKAKGQKPGPHSKHVGTPLKENFLEKLLPVYQRLADETLLKRCVNCLTQNANESLHNLIWLRCPKTVFVSKLRVELAVMQAVCHYNIGETNMTALSFPNVGDSTYRINSRRHKKRTSGIKKRSNLKFRQMFQCIKKARLQKKIATEKKEGTSYSAGAF